MELRRRYPTHFRSAATPAAERRPARPSPPAPGGPGLLSSPPPPPKRKGRGGGKLPPPPAGLPACLLDPREPGPAARCGASGSGSGIRPVSRTGPGAQVPLGEGGRCDVADGAPDGLRPGHGSGGQSVLALILTWERRPIGVAREVRARMLCTALKWRRRCSGVPPDWPVRLR